MVLLQTKFRWVGLMICVSCFFSCRTDIRRNINQPNTTSSNKVNIANDRQGVAEGVPITTESNPERFIVIEIPPDVSNKNNPFGTIPLTVLSGKNISWENKDRMPHTLVLKNEFGLTLASVEIPPSGSYTKELLSTAENKVAKYIFFIEGSEANKNGSIAVAPIDATVSTAAQAVQDRSVTIKIQSNAHSLGDKAFGVNPLVIEAGTEVTWINEDISTHSLSDYDGIFNSGNLRTGEKFSYRFTEPGTYDYSCDIHPDMEGRILVKATTSGEQIGNKELKSPTQAPTPAPSIASNGKVVEIKILRDAQTLGDRAFGQNPLVVDPGTEIVWINEDLFTHIISDYDGSFDSGEIAPGERFSHRFSDLGVYDYSSDIYLDMEGRIEVRSAIQVPQPLVTLAPVNTLTPIVTLATPLPEVKPTPTGIAIEKFGSARPSEYCVAKTPPHFDPQKCVQGGCSPVLGLGGTAAGCEWKTQCLSLPNDAYNATCKQYCINETRYATLAECASILNGNTIKNVVDVPIDIGSSGTNNLSQSNTKKEQFSLIKLVQAGLCSDYFPDIGCGVDKSKRIGNYCCFPEAEKLLPNANPIAQKVRGTTANTADLLAGNCYLHHNYSNNQSIFDGRGNKIVSHIKNGCCTNDFPLNRGELFNYADAGYVSIYLNAWFCCRNPDEEFVVAAPEGCQ
jgi:plastocyanin